MEKGQREVMRLHVLLNRLHCDKYGREGDYRL